MEMASLALTDFLPKCGSVEPNRVVSAVASAFGISRDQIMSKDRSRNIALPRQVAMYLMREEANATLPFIGETLGGRDHTTVMYACDKVAEMIERDDTLRRRVFQIRDYLYSQQPAV
jgi:chromosomal replication initiator protein